MKYKVEKDNFDNLWYGYRLYYECYWKLIYDTCSLTKIGCKYAVKRWHKKMKKNIQSEIFELE